MYIQICICMNSFANWEGVSTIFGLFLGESTFIDLLWRGGGGGKDEQPLEILTKDTMSMGYCWLSDISAFHRVHAYDFVTK